MNLWESKAGSKCRSARACLPSAHVDPAVEPRVGLLRGRTRNYAMSTLANGCALPLKRQRTWEMGADQWEARVYSGTWLGAAVHVSAARGSRTLLLCQMKGEQATQHRNLDTYNGTKHQIVAFPSTGTTFRHLYAPKNTTIPNVYAQTEAQMSKFMVLTRKSAIVRLCTTDMAI